MHRGPAKNPSFCLIIPQFRLQSSTFKPVLPHSSNLSGLILDQIFILYTREVITQVENHFVSYLTQIKSYQAKSRQFMQT